MEQSEITMSGMGTEAVQNTTDGYTDNTFYRVGNILMLITGILSVIILIGIPIIIFAKRQLGDQATKSNETVLLVLSVFTNLIAMIFIIIGMVQDK